MENEFIKISSEILKMWCELYSVLVVLQIKYMFMKQYGLKTKNLNNSVVLE
jgi:hypothetical protein